MIVAIFFGRTPMSRDIDQQAITAMSLVAQDIQGCAHIGDTIGATDRRHAMIAICDLLRSRDRAHGTGRGKDLLQHADWVV